MALSTEQTKEIIRSEKNLNPAVSSILFENEGGSATGTGNLWAYLHALASNLLSQLTDLFKTEVNEIVYLNIPATPQWIRAKMLLFQNGDVLKADPVNFVVYYDPIVEEKRIITQCSVRSTIEGIVQIKVAKGGSTPAPLSPTEITEATSYYAAYNPAGPRFNIISLPSDKLYIKAQIFYNGQYSDIIQDSVITAITNFIASLPFDGAMVISDLEKAIKVVEGVSDVVLMDVWARADVTAQPSSTRLIDNLLLTSTGNRRWETVSGYMVPETTAGFLLTDAGNLIFTIDG